MPCRPPSKRVYHCIQKSQKAHFCQVPKVSLFSGPKTYSIEFSLGSALEFPSCPDLYEPSFPELFTYLCFGQQGGKHFRLCITHENLLGICDILCWLTFPFPSISGQVYENTHTTSALHSPMVCLLGEDIP